MDSPLPSTRHSFAVRGVLIDFSTPCVMGIVNLTPDSFYDGGRHNTAEQALSQAVKIWGEGARWLDLGAQSSRPGATYLDPESEWSRLETPLRTIREALPEAVLSIDTFHAAVARRAIEAGADVINDISGGDLDGDMHDTIQELGCPYIVTHSPAPPEVMQQQTTYSHVTQEVFAALDQKVARLRQRGIRDLAVDPGFGFGKTLEQNWQLLRELRHFQAIDAPVLVGLSRKSMLYKTLDTTPDRSLNATTAAHVMALERGAAILRVHDAAHALEAIRIWQHSQPHAG